MENKYLCNAALCTGCGNCAQVCKKGCIQMMENEEGFLYPVFDQSACIACKLCEKNCPIMTPVDTNNSVFYMCWNKDQDIVLKSSSGGVFTALAKAVLDQNGVVFGAYQDMQGRNVYHVAVTRYEALDKIRLSKYAQSDMNSVCQQVTEFLLEKRRVLFSGTACQTAAVIRYVLNSAAKKQISLLYTVDVLCHGVTSQKTVNAFLKSKERHAHRHIQAYYFRVKTKDIGWHSGGGTRMHLIFDDGKQLVAPLGMDMFFMGFNHNLFLRESCYHCKYCGTERVSDFTIADYWGVPETCVSSEQLLYGVSVMTVNTNKASALFSQMKTNLKIQKIDPNIAIANNRSFQFPNSRPMERDMFFQLLNTMDYDRIIKRLLRKTYVKAQIKNLIGQNNIKKIKRLLKRER